MLTDDLSQNGSVWMGASDHNQIIYGPNNEFVISGDIKVAYEYLKKQFEPKTDSQSGPIHPMTKEELKLEQNKPLINIIEELPPTITSL